MLYNNDGYTSQTNQDVPHGKPRIDAFVVFIIDTHSYLIDCTGTSNSCPKMFNNIVESGRNMIVVFWRNASYIARPFKSSCSWLDISANPYLSKSSYTSPRVRKKSHHSRHYFKLSLYELIAFICAPTRSDILSPYSRIFATR